MTPADLAELLKTTAAAVLAEHGLDTSGAACRPCHRRAAPQSRRTAITPPTWRLSSPEGRRQPAEAGRLAGRSVGASPDGISAADVAGPGFVNLRIEAVSPGRHHQQRHRRRRRPTAAPTTLARPEHQPRVRLAPTRPGPIHIGGTRWAAVGDALGRLLPRRAPDVVREYYFNDHGAQIDRFAQLAGRRGAGRAAPEDGYAGDYIDEIAAQVLARDPDALSLPDDETRGDLPRASAST